VTEDTPHKEVTSAGARGAVLLVEDNPDAVEIYRLALRGAGYTVIEAPTLLRARACARILLPDIVVLDARLPDGDGLQVLSDWRNSESPMREVPVIVLTAAVSRQEIEAALVAGANEFVAKPCTGDVLALHVTRVLDTVRSRSRLPGRPD
jgi:two-component system OmpR family response regulator